MTTERKRLLRLGLMVPALVVAAVLLYESRWVVDRLQDSNRDSSVIVYLVFGAMTFVPALLLVAWAGRVAVRRGR